MAGPNTDADRSEAASTYKLQKAQERGSIFKSTEVTFVAILLAWTACIYGLGNASITHAGELISQALKQSARSSLTPEGSIAVLYLLSATAVKLAAPLLFVIWIAATLTAALQARGVFSIVPMVPDFSRLNPVEGVKRLLSAKSLIDLLRNAIKLAVLSGVVFGWGSLHVADLIAFHGLPVRTQAHAALAMIGSVLALLSVIYIVFALMDWMFNRWDFGRQMRMSKREVKDEHKEREGDPRIKSRLRELRMEWLRRARSLNQVKNADVLLTNPTHYAVALRYRHGEMPAPCIKARGAGELALRMRDAAGRYNIPVVQNAPLARALFNVPGNEPFVPESHFQEVARILRWVYAARRRQGVGSAS